MRILVTGAAGFIGAALSLRLLERGDHVIGVDNLNDYYDVALKEARLARLTGHPRFTDLRLDIGGRCAPARGLRHACTRTGGQPRGTGRGTLSSAWQGTMK